MWQIHSSRHQPVPSRFQQGIQHGRVLSFHPGQEGDKDGIFIRDSRFQAGVRQDGPQASHVAIAPPDQPRHGLQGRRRPSAPPTQGRAFPGAKRQTSSLVRDSRRQRHGPQASRWRIFRFRPARPSPRASGPAQGRTSPFPWPSIPAPEPRPLGRDQAVLHPGETSYQGCGIGVLEFKGDQPDDGPVFFGNSPPVPGGQSAGVSCGNPSNTAPRWPSGRLCRPCPRLRVQKGHVALDSLGCVGKVALRARSHNVHVSLVQESRVIVAYHEPRLVHQGDKYRPVPACQVNQIQKGAAVGFLHTLSVNGAHRLRAFALRMLRSFLAEHRPPPGRSIPKV